MPNQSQQTDNYCQNCKTPADLDAKYCKNCGKPISLSDAPFDLTKRFLESYPTYLVTLVSIIQGAALGYLLVAVDDQLSYVIAGEYDPIWTILLVGLFVLIVAIFVQYSSVAVVWRLTPTTVNSLAPFCLGVIQALAIFSIVRHQIAWVYFSMSLLWIVLLFVYIDIHREARRHLAENISMLEMSAPETRIIELMRVAYFAIFFSFGVTEALFKLSSLFLAVIFLVMNVMMFVGVQRLRKLSKYMRR